MGLALSNNEVKAYDQSSFNVESKSGFPLILNVPDFLQDTGIDKRAKTSGSKSSATSNSNNKSVSFQPSLSFEYRKNLENLKKDDNSAFNLFVTVSLKEEALHFDFPSGFGVFTDEISGTVKLTTLSLGPAFEYRDQSNPFVVNFAILPSMQYVQMDTKMGTWALRDEYSYSDVIYRLKAAIEPKFGRVEYGAMQLGIVYETNLVNQAINFYVQLNFDRK